MVRRKVQVPESRTAINSWPSEQSKWPSQKIITSALKEVERAAFMITLSEDDRWRVEQLQRQQVQMTAKTSDIAPWYGKDDDTNTLAQTPMVLHSLTCPFELSNEAFQILMAVQLGIPVPHAVFMAENLQNGGRDVWGDYLMNSPKVVGNARKRTHDAFVRDIAKIACEAGIPTSGWEREVPYADAPGDKRVRGDFITQRGGLVPDNVRYRFDKFTQLVGDAKIGHVYDLNHKPKTCNLNDFQNKKINKYRIPYRNQGRAFVPCVANSFAQLGSELLRLLFKLAGHAAAASTGGQPCERNDPVVSNEVEKLHAAFVALRGRFFNKWRSRLVLAAAEALAERLYGRSFALRGDYRYGAWMAARRPFWEPVFNRHASSDYSRNSSQATTFREALMRTRDAGESGEVDSPMLDPRPFSLSAGGSLAFSPMEEEEVNVDREG